MKLSNQKLQSGVTLLETLLYVGLASVTLLIFFTMYNLIGQARQKNYAIVEISGQGLEATQRISQSLRNAASVNLLPAASNNQISITNQDLSTTRFFLQSEKIWEQNNNNNPIALTNNRTRAISLKFSNVAATSAPASLILNFTLGTSLREDSQLPHEQTFQATASLRL